MLSAETATVVVSIPSLQSALQPAAGGAGAAGAPPSSYDGRGWAIEGFSARGDYHPYTLLAGVALSDMSVPDRGSLRAFPNSHILLQDEVREQIRQCSAAFSSPEELPSKPFLSDSQEVLMRPGDVFLCHQKIALAEVANLSADVQGIAYFKVSHVDHDLLKEPSLDGEWVEFGGADHQFQSAEESLLFDPSTHTETQADTNLIDLDFDFGAAPAPAGGPFVQANSNTNTNSNRMADVEDYEILPQPHAGSL